MDNLSKNLAYNWFPKFVTKISYLNYAFVLTKVNNL